MLEGGELGAVGAVINYTGSWCSQAQETSWNADWRFEFAHGVLTVKDDQVCVQQEKGIEDRGGYRHVGNDAQAYRLHEFYEAVTTGKQPGTPCQDNINTVEFVIDVVESFKSGTPISHEG